jgi:hypothetical protein
MENYEDYLEDGRFWCDITESNYYDSEDNAIGYLYDQFVSMGDYKDAAQIVENWDDVRFSRAMRMLNYYLNDYSITIGEAYYRSGAQALAYAYSQLAELAGYAEADAILDRFTVVENKLLTYSYVSVDHMGNEYKSGDNTLYEYNELGQVIRYSDNTELQRMYGGYHRNAFYTYDENGRVIQIKTGYTNDRTGIIPTGVLLTIAPFAIGILLFGALIIFFIAKRRRNNY